ncbi:bestrophin-4 isoform X2 [Halyomorpha halys]|nr:bestrophin-4-like isoform X2 [Halyomorpha halys]
MAIPSPDRIMHALALYVGSNDEDSRILRRTLIRYLNLSFILILRSVSSAVMRRFPTLDHLVEAGFMTRMELEMYTAVPTTDINTYWFPCSWFVSLLKDACSKNKINDACGLKLIMEEFNEFRSKCGLLWSYDWVSIPLVYTQVVMVATYSFFLAALVGRQYVNESKKEPQMEVDKYFPVFTVLQFLFYMGLLKVAEQLINPFGEDDEDFELNWLIDRHTKASYLGVDTLLRRTPPLVKDKYFEEINVVLPYTGSSASYKSRIIHRGSTYRMKIPKNQQTMFLPQATDEGIDNNQRKKPMTSISGKNIRHGSAGLWRPDTGRIDIEKADYNEVVASFQIQSGVNIKQFFKRTATVHKSNAGSKPFDISQKQRWQRRSFNTTIDSYCSTKNIVQSDSSLDMSPEAEKSTKDNEIRMLQLRRSMSGSLVDLPAKNVLNSNRSPRYHNHSSNQSKKVRWKSNSKDPEGDFFGDNDLSIKEDKSVVNSEKSSFQIKPEDNKIIDPLWLVIDPSKATKTYYDYNFWSNNNMSSPFSNSLPNLHL